MCSDLPLYAVIPVDGLFFTLHYTGKSTFVHLWGHYILSNENDSYNEFFTNGEISGLLGKPIDVVTKIIETENWESEEYDEFGFTYNSEYTLYFESRDGKIITIEMSGTDYYVCGINMAMDYNDAKIKLNNEDWKLEEEYEYETPECTFVHDDGRRIHITSYDGNSVGDVMLTLE